MSEQNTVDFKLTVPLVKSERTDGWYIRGVAAGLGPDIQNDELLPQAIHGLADQINQGGFYLNDWHNKNTIMSEVGEIVKATVAPDFQLEVEVKLDEDNPNARYLWEKLGKGKQYGFSIEGKTIGFFKDFNKATGKQIRKHATVLLDHIAVTTKPIFTPSLGTVIRKAIDEAEASSAEGETMTTPNADQTDTVTESAAPANDTVQKSVRTESEELVARLMADDAFTTLIKSTVAEAIKANESTITEGDTTEVTATTPETPVTENVAEIVKSTILAVSQSFNEKLEALADRIPETGAPVVLQKSEEETVNDILATLNASDRLRLSLAASHDELGKFRR